MTFQASGALPQSRGAGGGCNPKPPAGLFSSVASLKWPRKITAFVAGEWILHASRGRDDYRILKVMQGAPDAIATEIMCNSFCYHDYTRPLYAGGKTQPWFSSYEQEFKVVAVVECVILDISVEVKALAVDALLLFFVSHLASNIRNGCNSLVASLWWFHYSLCDKQRPRWRLEWHSTSHKIGSHASILKWPLYELQPPGIHRAHHQTRIIPISVTWAPIQLMPRRFKTTWSCSTVLYNWEGKFWAWKPCHHLVLVQLMSESKELIYQLHCTISCLSFW